MKLPERYRAGLIDNLPARMIPGLIRYIEDGILPGDFLQAILRNDLKEACAHADDENQGLIFQYVFALHNYAPSACWGSPAHVADWIEQRTLERTGGTSEEAKEALL